MKQAIFFLLLILSIIELSISTIQPKNYCIKSETKCSGKYKKACGSDYCTLNSETCSKLAKYEYFIEEILNPKPKVKLMLYDKLKNSVSKCHVPLKSNELEFKLNDVCIRKLNCITKKLTSLKPECMCAARYSTPCKWDNKYCSTDQRSCSELKSKLTANKTILVKIKFCAWNNRSFHYEFFVLNFWIFISI